MMDRNSSEYLTALHAVQTASRLCQGVRQDLVTGGSLEKSDHSPVTVADFGSQAVLCKTIREHFPGDPIVAEEDSKELRKPNHVKILEQVTHYVSEYISCSSQEVCSWIDFGTDPVASRFWTIDPIDGTKGFLRNDQYAIALALIENGRVELGLLACPNLYADGDRKEGDKGCLFVAFRGKGAFQLNMEGEERKALSVSRVANPKEATFTESFDAEHADHLFHQRLAQRLNISKPSLKMDSQAKYGILARGEVTLYLRIPLSSKPGYREKIWDHAAGSLIAEEAGGRVTDALGQSLDFSSGIKMEKNHGILVSNGLLHDPVLKALGRLWGEGGD